MKVGLLLVCGGRDFSDGACVDKLLADIDPTAIVQGGARGADTLAKDWADRHGVTCFTIPADWDAHGRAAGPIRNKMMLMMNPDMVLAIGGGRGTQNMLKLATDAGVPCVHFTQFRNK